MKRQLKIITDSFEKKSLTKVFIQRFKSTNVFQLVFPASHRNNLMSDFHEQKGFYA